MVNDILKLIIKIVIITFSVLFVVVSVLLLVDKFLIDGGDDGYDHILPDTTKYDQIRTNTTKYVIEQTNKKDSVTYEFNKELERIKSYNDSDAVMLFKKLAGE